jgi:FkbH-like protein
MGKTNYSVDDLLDLDSRAELRANLARLRTPLALTDVAKLTERARAMQPPVQAYRLAVAHSYTSELLNPWLAFAAALEGFDVQAWHAPYGTLVQQAQGDSALVRQQPDMTLLMLQREDLHPDLAGPVTRFDSARQEALRQDVLARLQDLVTQFRCHKVGQIVVTLLPSSQGPGAGIHDAQAARSETRWWAELKSGLGAFLRDSVAAATFLDLDEVVLQVGRSRFFDLRLWYSARFPFTPEAGREIARRLMALASVMRSPKAKVIVLDADNTLWGGIIGEDGMDGIALGPDYPGNAFVQFQRRLLDFQQRGFLLAMCSKNNAADVDEVLQSHPHQLLRDKHFVARRVNWLPKPDNLVSLAAELNLGLESFIFVDDSDHECAAVRQRLPQVEVIQMPARPIDVPDCLEQVARLEVLSLTEEDMAKTQMYAQERLRRETRDAVASGAVSAGDYLASLDMKMEVSFDKAAHLARLSQMTLKTNQFNLTTRRYDERQMQDCIQAKDHVVADFSLADVFGHSGVVGLAIVRMVDDTRAELDTFLMSCRVIGRKAESAFLHCLLRRLADIGCRELVADYVPTPKNELVKTFLQDHGFAALPDGRFAWSLVDQPPLPPTAYPIAVSVQT